MKRLYLAAFAALLFASNGQAADIANDVRKGFAAPDSSDGGYLELGVGMIHKKRGFRLNIAGAYRYRGFFIEASHGAESLNLGYNFWTGNRWSIDFLASSANGGIHKKKPDYASLSDEEREDAVLDRDTFYNGAGLRLTGYFGNAIFQYKLVTDIHDNNGITSSARLGYSWQVQNWNFHSVIGANFASRKTSQYWYGVTEEQASERFPQHDSGSTISYGAEVGVTYPLTENIVFRSTALYAQSNLPTKDREYDTFVRTFISYVF